MIIYKKGRVYNAINEIIKNYKKLLNLKYQALDHKWSCLIYKQDQDV